MTEAYVHSHVVRPQPIVGMVDELLEMFVDQTQAEEVASGEAGEHQQHEFDGQRAELKPSHFVRVDFAASD